MSTPQVPPRPIRALHPNQSPMGFTEIPRIPPRPAHRMPARSRSPSRDNFPRSPLNEIPNSGSKSGSMYSNDSQNTSESNFEAPQRPPSVSLPSIGQEGNEYADIEYGKSQALSTESDSNQNEPTQLRNVGSDLPLHAPKPSLSSSSAKARVSTLTRTDSSQAAAAGFGKAGIPLTSESLQSPALRSKVSFSRTESVASTECPASAHTSDSDHGIPEIGQRVPMYPDAGDVQAPSPSPFPQTGPPGIGFHNDGTQRPGRHHGRTRSGREVFRGPPGSYGMHGHGVPHNDQFEKAWYDKHPDALVREEHGQYGPGIGGGRGEWALSSEDLNKIVRDTASRGPGTSPNLVATPNEQIGYMATEEYTSRINTPASYIGKAHSNHSQTHVESPLRKASIVVDVNSKDASEPKEPHALARPQSQSVTESETEDDEIHIDDPAVRQSTVGSSGYDPPTEDLGANEGNTDVTGGWIEEAGYGVPILAADEVAKEPGSEYLHPAVFPVQERRGAIIFSGQDSDTPPYQIVYRNPSGSNSKPSSRPVSVHGGSLPNLSRFTSHDEREDIHTPLEDVDEYEPLFPDQGDKEGPYNPTFDKFKRREIMKRRFPSQDIWEDTPNSLQLQATVDTPESTEEQAALIPKMASAGIHAPGMEVSRKAEAGEDEKDKLGLKDERLAIPLVKNLIRGSDGLGLKQRFPSRDIWEDSPDSACLETTVGGPHADEAKSPSAEGAQVPGASAANEKPSIPPRPAKSKLSGDSHTFVPQPVPSIPARPPRKQNQVLVAEISPPLATVPAESSPVESKQISPPESRKAPTLPDRPKPQVPARSSRSVVHENPEMTPLSKSTSAISIGSSDAGEDKRGMTSSKPAPRPKPALPSRPLASSLKAGFLFDLDKRLQLGPQAPKPQEKTSVEPEVTEEKVPLADARKGRVRGPARRKPGASSALIATSSSIAETVEEEGPTIKPKWATQEPWTVWQTVDDGSLKISNVINTASSDARTKNEPSSESPVLAASIDGTKTSEVITPDSFTSTVGGPSSADPPAVSSAAETDQGNITSSSKAIESLGSSVKDYTPSSTPSPLATDEILIDAASQTDEKAITLKSGIEGGTKQTASVGGEA